MDFTHQREGNTLIRVPLGTAVQKLLWCCGLSLTCDSAWGKGNACGMNLKAVRAGNAGLFPLLYPVLEVLGENLF